MNINILGGGPASLYFAILMKKQNPNHTIRIIERDGPNDTFGWGIVFSERTITLLEQNDGDTAEQVVKSAQTWEHTITVHRGQAIPVRGNRFYGIRRLRLLQILHKRCEDLGVQIKFHTNISDARALREIVAESDLFVGADGANSFVRRTLADWFLPVVDTRQNRFTWLGTHQRFEGLTLTFCQAMEGLFVAHAYTFDADTSTFIVEVPPGTWERSGLARMSESETCTYLEKIFADDLHGNAVTSNGTLKWTNFNLIKNKRWYHRNMVLLGDALHTVHFSIGSGTKLALEDAVVLSQCIEHVEGVEPALAEFQRVRKARIDQFQDAALSSLAWLERVEEHLSLEPVPFAYALVTRSNRVGYNRLKRQAPEFIAQYNQWRERLPSTGPIPREFIDLFTKVAYGHLATMMADGKPQVTSVWVDYDGECVLINSAKGRQKDLNMERNRNVALEIPDPDNPNRYVSIRGQVVEITESGADEHLDKLARRYLARDTYPPTWKYPNEVRRIYRIRPDHVTAWEPFG